MKLKLWNWLVNKHSQLEGLPDKICGFFGAFKKQNENSRRCLWKERPAHIFHHRSLDLSFIDLAPPHNIKQKGAFCSILRATLLMRKKGRSRAWLAVLTVFGRFRLPKHLWRARLSPLGWGAGAKVQFGVDNVCDWGCFWAQEEHGLTTRKTQTQTQTQTQTHNFKLHASLKLPGPC